MDTFLLTDWVTIRGNNSGGTVTTIIQEESQWLDLTPYGTAFFWLDCRGVSGTSTSLFIDTSPCRDEAFFAQIAASVTLGVSQSPVLISAGQPGASILARFVRWRLTTASVSTWEACFRIFAGAVVPGA
jgi:hypothetical protein